jgi:hypothetical protein
LARQNTRLADIQYVPSTVGAVLTNPASTKTFVAGFWLFNTGTTAQRVALYNVPDSGGSVGTAANANFMAEIVLEGKETRIVPAPYPITLIDTNDTIQAVTQTASQVTIQLLGDRDA